MALQFKKATKQQAKLRLALMGPAGSGKSFTALAIGTNLGQRVAVIDTEHGSASKYADRFEFDVLELDDFDPLKYVEAIKVAEDGGYDVIVVDSLSHEWNGRGGALEQVDDSAGAKGGKFSNGWRNVTPKHNSLIDAIVRSRAHIIGTMRTKMEYKPGEDGTIQRLGMAPVQRDGMEYEFDVAADLQNAAMRILKTRCSALEGKKFLRPGKDVADILKAWLTDGAPVAAEPKPELAKTHGASHTSLEGQLTDSNAVFDGLSKKVEALKPGSETFDADYEAIATPLREMPSGHPVRRVIVPKLKELKDKHEATKSPVVEQAQA